ncbi:MAG TPA: tripartite tricarboxylate transporter substrate-binding protein, partial [Burkholderiaceae bacterium]|nr:tripartite tricarboxylate transporter substrate-binding protein [Burkholderiaceae bacterium]
FGLFGPAKMAPDLVQRVSDAARTAMKIESIRKRLEQDAAEAVASSPEDFARFVKADISRWAPLVQRSGATPES